MARHFSLIRNLREARGWTRRQLAYQLEVTESSIYRWEQGLGRPHHAHLQALAELFDVNPTSLLPPFLGRSYRKARTLIPFAPPRGVRQ